MTIASVHPAGAQAASFATQDATASADEICDSTGAHHAQCAFGVYPPGSKPFGLTYGEWTARWWQWLFSIPTPRNPNLDSTGKNCNEGQAGHVWFLAGRFQGGPPTERACTIPAAKSLLLPIVNIGFGDGQNDCNGIGPLPPDPNLQPCDEIVGPLRQAGVWATVTAGVVTAENNPPALELTVDGIELVSPLGYRALAPRFHIRLPQDNLMTYLFGARRPAGIYGPDGSDGYWVMLTPLSPGHHTVHFRTGDGFQDIIYELTVEQEE